MDGGAGGQSGGDGDSGVNGVGCGDDGDGGRKWWSVLITKIRNGGDFCGVCGGEMMLMVVMVVMVIIFRIVTKNGNGQNWYHDLNSDDVCDVFSGEYEY